MDLNMANEIIIKYCISTKITNTMKIYSDNSATPLEITTHGRYLGIIISNYLKLAKQYANTAYIIFG